MTWRRAGIVSSLVMLAWASAPAIEPVRPVPPPLELRFPGHDPSAQFDRAGRLHALFVREEGGRGRVFYVRSGGAAAAPIPVTPSSYDVEAVGESRPSLEILPGGVLVAVYAARIPGGWNGEIRAQRSTDGGTSWSEPVVVNDDRRTGVHGRVSTALAGDRVYAAWLDSRAGEQGVEVARTSDGIHFERNRTADPRTCQCCATALAADRSARFWIAYRDLEGKDLRDISIVRGDPKSFDLAPPAKVSKDGWRLDGCPESGPRIAIESDGTLWVAWFTGAGRNVFAAASRDGGRTFAPRTPIGPASGEGAPAKHPEIAALPDGRVVALYESRATVFARVLERSRASWSLPVELAREATYARIAIGAEQSALAFTARNGNDTQAVLSTKPLERLPRS